MSVILFRPFDIGKWFVIGFSAFLAGLLAGGNGFNNFNVPNIPGKSQGSFTYTPPTPQEQLHQLHDKFSHLFQGAAFGLVMAIFVTFLLVILALTLVFLWLGARGQFMFLDNIVRNRGAIAVPWQYYARQGNSLFGIYLIFIVVSFLILLPFIGAGIYLAWPLIQQSRGPVTAEIPEFLLLGVVYVCISIAINIVIFVFREFGVPIMFRQGIPARQAFFISLKLMETYPGSIAVFILLRIALFIGVVVVGLMICCATLCCGTLPYIGTVLLLPALIFVRCFTLDCLAQFGPEYNVFTVDAESPTAAPVIPPRAF